MSVPGLRRSHQTALRPLGHDPHPEPGTQKPRVHADLGDDERGEVDVSRNPIGTESAEGGGLVSGGRGICRRGWTGGVVPSHAQHARSRRGGGDPARVGTGWWETHHAAKMDDGPREGALAPPTELVEKQKWHTKVQPGGPGDGEGRRGAGPGGPEWTLCWRPRTGGWSSAGVMGDCAPRGA